MLASVTAAVAATLDPSAVVIAARGGGEPWCCLEQPEREGLALATLGAAHELRASGGERFGSLAADWRALAAAAFRDQPGSAPGSGLVAIAGFAFAPDGGRAPHWRAFPPAVLTVPEVSLVRHRGALALTLTVAVAPDDDPEAMLARAEHRLGELRAAALPLLDPAPIGVYSVASAAPPEHYEAAVARAVEQIRAGSYEKVVLAREVDVHAPIAFDPGAVLGALRAAFPTCYVFCVGRGEAAFLGASPELLVRREGMRASSVALAGSTRRSADPAVDDHLGERLLRSEKDRSEQAIVARRIERALRPYSIWVTAAPEPALVRVANIQHLGTPIRAQLAGPHAAIELAGALHPTPAVGGEPLTVAGPLIPALEGIDRGWYAGAVGWTDAEEDGELCVALRCALLEGPLARCYAGVGVVAGSDPAAELAETEVKLGALLPLLAG